MRKEILPLAAAALGVVVALGVVAALGVAVALGVAAALDVAAEPGLARVSAVVYLSHDHLALLLFYHSF